MCVSSIHAHKLCMCVCVCVCVFVCDEGGGSGENKGHITLLPNYVLNMFCKCYDMCKYCNCTQQNNIQMTVYN